MTSNVGREGVLTIDGQSAAYVRTKSLNWNGESIDITNGESNGVRKLLDASGQEQIDMSIEGVTDNTFLAEKALTVGGDRIFTCSFVFDKRDPASAAASSLSGDFRLSSYEESAPYNEAVTFSATLESTGEWTYTAEA